jgi:hypothetical protein
LRSLLGLVPSAACSAAEAIASAVASTSTRAASTPLARSGVGPMLVSPTRASAIRPPSRRTIAATATIDHACATRLNFS